MIGSRSSRADLALVVVALLWGITFPLIRSALADIAPHQFVAWRFALATIAFVPLLLFSRAARAGLRRAWKPGLWLGALAWISYFTQTIGLQTVPAGRAAFITGTSVIMVPLLAPLLKAGRPSRIDLVAAAIATLGIYLLTLTRGPGASGLGVGDLWIFVCALSYSFYIHGLQKVLRHPHHESSLAFVQILAIGGIGAVMLVGRGGIQIELTAVVLRALIVCALLATVGTFWLQTRFQGRTTPQRVALIFALEPVFATGFAWWLLGERLSQIGVLGAGLILLAVFYAEFASSKHSVAPNVNS